MSEANRQGGASKAAETYTKAEVDELLENAKSDQDKAVATARTEATQAACERISAILSCDEAANRPKMAQHLALKTNTSAEDAQGLLAAAAEEQSAKSDPLAAAMQGRSPGVSSDDGAADIESEADETDAAAQAILNA